MIALLPKSEWSILSNLAIGVEYADVDGDAEELEIDMTTCSKTTDAGDERKPQN